MPDTAPFGFEALIHPHTPEAFLDAYFETSHLHVVRDAPGYYDEVLTVDDLDAYLQNQMLSHPHVSVSKNGASTDVERWQVKERYRLTGIADNHALFALMHEGHTVSLNRLQLGLPKVAACCQRLEAEWRCRAVANLYMTPARSQGFGVHSDQHDVLVLQISGTKNWEIYATPAEGEEPSLTDAFTLRPGDFLYVPRGVYHRAATADNSSVHITLGLYPFHAYDLVRALAELAERDPAFSRAVPPPFSTPEKDVAFKEAFMDQLRALVERVDPNRLRAHLDEHFLKTASYRLDHRLTDVLAVHTLDAGTRVRRRANLIVRTWRDARNLHLQVYKTKRQYPLFLSAVIERIVQDEAFQVRDLPGPFDEASKVELVRTFIREGFLEILPDGEAA